MAHVYTVEFVLFDAHEAQGPIRTHILADDRYEAVVLARQLLAMQDPLFDIDRIDWCKVMRSGA